MHSGGINLQNHPNFCVVWSQTSIRQFLKGFEKDQLEIRPGQANALKFMNRVAPEFILTQLSKPTNRMLAEPH
jgi:uncharacterized oxidoreductase